MTTYLIQEGSHDKITQRELTDEEAVTHFAPQLIFSVDKQRVLADGKTTATITLQNMSVVLSDGKRREIHEARKVTIIEDGEYTDVELDTNGCAQIKRAFAAVGTYEFKPHELLAGVGIAIEAI
jgi:hypothetical protein